MREFRYLERNYTLNPNKDNENNNHMLWPRNTRNFIRKCRRDGQSIHPRRPVQYGRQGAEQAA